MKLRMLLPMLAVLANFVLSAPAHAGCGCDKPPPPLAAIRPAFASPQNTVTLFASGLTAGKSYDVVFGAGTATVTVPAVSVLRRDFADGIAKLQVPVVVPDLPAGPTSVTLKSNGRTLLAVPASDFTVLQAPIALTEENAETIAACYRAAVGSDGTFYLPLDITAITQHMVFSGLGKLLPLKFAAQDIAIYNTQGVLMQLLTPENAAIYAIADDNNPGNSFSLTYDRHEFVTYRSQHVHVGGFGLDPADPAWHLDGSRHIDHDHLVLAIHGSLKNGKSLAPGTTNTFDLSIVTALDGGAASTQRLIQWSTECLHASANSVEAHAATAVKSKAVGSMQASRSQ
jgi:hypothetical protein